MRCIPATDFSVSKALAWRSAIHDDPPYQRESSIWSLEKQQLFIDSLLNGYDVPKIYLHDFRGRHPTKVYAVVDGRQRLTTIWRFLSDEFPLANDFRIEPGNLPDLPDGVRHPAAGDRFSGLDPAWQQVLRTTHLAVVLIQNATEEDIEDLFSRLNNGEPLNAAERRNAVGGEATRLIRRIAGHQFFVSRVRFANARYQHLDAAARILAIEVGGGQPPDLRSRALDGFVRDQRRLASARRRELADRIFSRLDLLCAVFEPADPLLARQSSPTIYYLLAGCLVDPPPRGWASDLRKLLGTFEADRRSQLQRVEEEQDPELREYSHLLHVGVNEPRSLARRLEIMAGRLSIQRPDIVRPRRARTP